MPPKVWIAGRATRLTEGVLERHLAAANERNAIGRPRQPLETYWEGEPNSGCWLWTGAVDGHGYGMVRDRGPSGRGPSRRAHRVIYELLIGPIPEGLQLDHLCKVRSCVNPAHLEAVTIRENVQRSDVGRVNRNKTTCPRGHPYDGINSIGARTCRRCGTESSRRNRAKRRDANCD